ISDVIKLWIIVQQKWVYLENIFIDSNLQFGEDAKRFDTADKLYRKIIFYYYYYYYLNLIEKIQKSSNEYLNTKRQLLDH
ncbi:unnamed protein product, partial [Rotaria sp. Silwood2]